MSHGHHRVARRSIRGAIKKAHQSVFGGPDFPALPEDWDTNELPETDDEDADAQDVKRKVRRE